MGRRQGQDSGQRPAFDSHSRQILRLWFSVQQRVSLWEDRHEHQAGSGQLCRHRYHLLYLRSQGTTWDEVDFEFLGNLSGDPYTVHTNVFCGGKGDREQQFRLWFDPTEDFHTYSVLWNPRSIILSVDGTPIREFKNLESVGLPFPNRQPMRVFSSIWNADSWATRGGLIKTDWSKAPFTASYRDYIAEACVWSSGRSACSGSRSSWWSEELDVTGQQKLGWVQKNYMIYDYCTDTKRFPQGLPKECTVA